MSYLFWFAMLVNKYKPGFYDRKIRKMRNLGIVYMNELYLQVPLCYEQNRCADRIYIILNANLKMKVH